MKKYYDVEGALMIPVETIALKVQERDFKYFLEQKNFYQVIDTLDKFQKHLVEPDSPEAKHLVVFKRQLCQIFQLQNMSLEEHEK